MFTIQTKYAIGDVVFRSSYHETKKTMPCPDCKGSGKWKAVSPAGGEHEFDCPRCLSRYTANDDLRLTYVEFAPSFTCLTIGSVRHDTAERDGRSKTSYMAVETGVGSGSIYYEADLFPTEEEAMEAAKVECDRRNTETDWVVKLYNKRLEFSDYQLKDAMVASAESKASDAAYKLRYFKDDLAECEDMDSVKALLERDEQAA